MDPEHLLADARLLRRAARLLRSYNDEPDVIAALLRVSDALQNQACGFIGEAVEYDSAPYPPPPTPMEE